MKLHRPVLLALLFALAALLVPAAALGAEDPGAPSGDGIAPEWVEDNPKCEDLDPSLLEFKVEPVVSGEYSKGPLTVNLNVYEGEEEAGPEFDWTSNLGIDLVIVKGGDNANAYYYEPEDTADTHLHAPVNPQNEKYFGLSHVSFCYDFELEVEKNAETDFKRDYDWEIEKSNDTEEPVTLSPGESQEVNYEVTVKYIEPPEDFDWTVEGTITVKNPAPFAAEGVDVMDEISDVGAAEVDCNGGEGGDGLPATIPAEGELSCSYFSELPDGAERTNTATATSETTGIGDGEATAAVTFSEPSVVEDECVTVTDDMAEEGASTALGEACLEDSPETFTYEKTFGPFDNLCETHEFTNTAEFVTNDNEDTGEDSSTVEIYVECELEVEKTAETEFKRQYFWDIKKFNDAAEPAMVMPGQSYTVNYEVIVDLLGEPEDFGWAVHGTITIKNPADFPVQVNVTDEITGVGAVEVDCNEEEEIAAEDTLECTYESALPDGEARINTAIAESETEGVAGGEASAPVSFEGTEPELIDECVTVTDDMAEEGASTALGEVCFDEAPKTFEYEKTFQFGQEDCDETFEFPNTAKFETNDTEATGEDSSTVVIEVKCEEGCTLTQGYWKTHSKYGPAPYDETWALVGEDTEFDSSGLSWYQLFWTPPKGGNAYIILAHQYMAAILNGLNGASMPTEVSEALEDAKPFMEDYGTNSDAKGKPRKEMLKLAEILAEYNEGDIGPGHCSEDGYSPSSP